MRTLKVLLYITMAFLAFVVVSAVVSAVFTALAIIWALVWGAATLAIVAGMIYGMYRLYDMIRDDSPASPESISVDAREPTHTQSVTNVERLQQEYANGALSEAELERRLERELDEREMDSIDRELERERR